MKLQLGKQYIRKDGKTTGFLVNNNEDAIAFPFLDPVHGVKYDDHGWPKTSENCAHENSQRIVKEVDFRKDVTSDHKTDAFCYEVPNVMIGLKKGYMVISMKDYDRFKALEEYVKEIATFAKENGL